MLSQGERMPQTISTTSLDSRAATFLRNMKALWRQDPLLAAAIDAIDDDQRVPVETARLGGFTARLPTPQGDAVYLHSRHDPLTEARRFAESVVLAEKFCLVVTGVGLGYHVRALLDRVRGDFLLICCEPNLSLLAAALTCTDLSEAIASRKLVFLADDDKRHLHDKLQPFAPLIMLGAEFVQHAPSMRVAEKSYAAVTALLAEFVSYTRMTMVTLVHNSKITCRNIAMNLATYVSTPPIDVLRNRFAGDPAIVVSAGPSLKRNVDLLGALKGRAVLCAVQTALRPLMQRGITPDFVTSLDFHEMSRKFFEDVGDLTGVHLIAEPKAAWPVIDHYPGPVSILENSWARLLLGDQLAARDGLRAGATVAHLAFYLAEYMGCNPIIFVGQDLAYTGHVFYTPGVEVHRAWAGELNRFHPMEMKEWERIARNRPILRQVIGNNGGELYTDELLFTYLEQFEKDIAACRATVINATEGGARIRGTQVAPLSEVIERHCVRAIDPSRFAYRGNGDGRDASRLPAAAEQLRRRLAELDDVVQIGDELIALLAELDELTHDPPRFNQRLVRVDELRARVYHDTRAYQIVNAATQLAELRRFSSDRHIGADGLSGPELAKRQIARDREFVTAVRDGAVEVRGMLHDALTRFSSAEERD